MNQNKIRRKLMFWLIWANTMSIYTTVQPKPLFDTWIGVVPSLTDGRIQILQIYPNSPAEKAGLKQWDYIIAINKQKIGSHQDFQFAITSLSPGNRINIQYERKSKIYITEIQIEKRERINDTLARAAPEYLHLERYTNGQKYNLKLQKSKIKVLYFLKNIQAVQDAMTKRLYITLNQQFQSNLLLYGITTISCKSVRLPKRNSTSLTQEFLCDEIRLPLKTPLLFDIFYDSDFAHRVFRIEQEPAIIIIDSQNIIRFADYVSENTLNRVFDVIRQLESEM